MMYRISAISLFFQVRSLAFGPQLGLPMLLGFQFIHTLMGWKIRDMFMPTFGKLWHSWRFTEVCGKIYNANGAVRSRWSGFFERRYRLVCWGESLVGLAQHHGVPSMGYMASQGVLRSGAGSAG